MALFGKKARAEGDGPAISEEQVLEALRGIVDPDLNKNIVELNFVKSLRICGGQVAFTIELTTPACPVKDQFRRQAEDMVGALPGVESVQVKMDANVVGSQGLLAKNQLPGVKNVIAVSSGKGGVGKSTVAVNLACALARTGAKVGLLDADVYGPNVPIMLGLSGRPEGNENKIVPLTYRECDLKVMSMAFLVAEDQPVIWRGPMLHSAVKQFLFDVMWGELDYLVVDLPPGTGDAQLSLAQQSHLMGAVIVTTPQDVSVLDVKKAISMFQQVNVPVLGVVENMAGMAITGTIEGGGRRITVQGPDGPIATAIAADGTFALELAVFGSGGGDKIAHRFGVPVLGRIPLDPAVRVGGDAGRPVVVQRPDSLVAQRFCEVAGQLAMRVSTLNMATGTTMSV